MNIRGVLVTYRAGKEPGWPKFEFYTWPIWGPEIIQPHFRILVWIKVERKECLLSIREVLDGRMG